MRTLTAFVAAFVLVAAEAPADAVKKEMTALNGEWSMVSGERDGEAVADALIQSGRRSSKDGETTVMFGDMVFMKAKFAIDPSKKPKTIDYDVTDGTAKGKRVLGIYEIDGDKVKFCFAAPDKDRPTEFAAKEGSGHTLSVWKRKKE